MNASIKSLLIRPYRPSDCASMAQLFYDTVHSINAADYSTEALDAWADGKLDLDLWNRSFLTHRTLVAEFAGQVVGFADMDESGYLDRLYIHRDHQSRGIATALCNALEAEVCAPVYVTHASITARPFFEGRGYRVVQPQQVECRGVWMTNYVMEKSVQSARKGRTAMTEVVAALIWDGDRFLICQRPAHKARGLLWEFVGGKVEPGESKAQALIRECREELAVTVEPGAVFMDVTHVYPDLTVHLTLFNAVITEGIPQLLEHNDIRWISAPEIDTFEFCPADEEILAQLKQRCGR